MSPIDHRRCENCNGLYTDEMWQDIRSRAPRMADALGSLCDAGLCERCAFELDPSTGQPSTAGCGMPGCGQRQDERWPAQGWFVIRRRRQNGQPYLDWELRPLCIGCSRGSLGPGPKPDYEPSPRSAGGRNPIPRPIGAPGTRR